jgi:hypothetical protein
LRVGKGNNIETLCSQQKLIIVSASNRIRGLPRVFRDFRIKILDQSRTNSKPNECENIIKRLSQFQKESFFLKMSVSSKIAEHMFPFDSLELSLESGFHPKVKYPLSYNKVVYIIHV